MKLTESELTKELEAMPGWEYKDGSIVREYKTGNFPNTMALTAGIGALCQQYDHHPDYLTLKYSSVTVAFSTHTEGGITEKDINIAKEIEKLKLFS